MRKPFTAIRFQSWDNLFSFCRGLENWFYRGQACAHWALQSSLERSIGVEHGSSLDWQHTERWMLRKFRAFAHNYLAHPPPDDDLLEWLALMQHHGAPTRLLDCTFSFPVAAFFAAWEGGDDLAVWAFNWNQFRKSATDRFGLKIDPDFAALDFYEAVHSKANEFLTRTASGALVFPVVPRHSNERLEAQQGLFLFPCDTARTLEENFESLVGESCTQDTDDRSCVIPYDPNVHNSRMLRQHWVLKCVLRKEERSRVLVDLHSMNIHEASLFPGLDGFARSLRRYTVRDR